MTGMTDVLRVRALLDRDRAALEERTARVRELEAALAAEKQELARARAGLDGAERAVAEILAEMREPDGETAGEEWR